MPIKMSQPELVGSHPNATPACNLAKLEQDDTTVASLDSGVLVDKSTSHFNSDNLNSDNAIQDDEKQLNLADQDNTRPLMESVYDDVLGANDQELAKRQYVDDDDADDDDDDDHDDNRLPRSKRLATDSKCVGRGPLPDASTDKPVQQFSPAKLDSSSLFADGASKQQNSSPSDSQLSADERKSSERGSQQPEEPEQLRKLFIGGLDWSTSEETLRQHFEKFGEVSNCVVITDVQTKRSRGFGFVIYAKSSMVDRAQEARPHEVDGREVQSKRAISREDSGKPEAEATVKKVYLGGLSDDIQESELRDYFKEFGNIVNINIVVHKETGKRRGFAFIEYDDWDPVDKIVLYKFHTIKDKRVEAKKAIPKIEMDARKRIDPRASMSGSLMSLAAGVPPPSAHDVRGGRGSGRGALGPAYLWDAPYGAALHQGYPAAGLDGYPPHYHPPSAHYGGAWMMHGGNQGGAGSGGSNPYGFRGSHGSGMYGRNGYSGQAAVAAAAAAAAAAASGWPDYGDFSPAVVSQGVGPMRHLASYQHRNYRPYANSNGGSHSLGGSAGSGSAPRGGRGYNP